VNFLSSAAASAAGLAACVVDADAELDEVLLLEELLPQPAIAATAHTAATPVSQLVSRDCIIFRCCLPR
jgi:hypothetical protein